MTFRYARHTANLHKIEQFYIDIVGLERLGGFTNHALYDGVFLGHRNADWHLEFTTSPDVPTSKFDEDDILVFYVNTTDALNAIKDRLKHKNIGTLTPKNPYWQENGVMIADPDGHLIVFAIR